MTAALIYGKLLRLYPRDYRARFAAEMLKAFEVTASERGRDRGHFIFSEMIGLVAGAGSEWIAKLTTDASLRGRTLPDLVKMRPPGVPRELHYWQAGDRPPACSPDTWR